MFKIRKIRYLFSTSTGDSPRETKYLIELRDYQVLHYLWYELYHWYDMHVHLPHHWDWLQRRLGEKHTMTNRKTGKRSTYIMPHCAVQDIKCWKNEQRGVLVACCEITEEEWWKLHRWKAKGKYEQERLAAYRAKTTS